MSGSQRKPGEAESRFGPKPNKSIQFYIVRVRDRPFRVDGSDPTLTDYRACAQKLAGNWGEGASADTDGYPYLATRTPQCKHCSGRNAAEQRKVIIFEK